LFRDIIMKYQKIKWKSFLVLLLTFFMFWIHFPCSTNEPWDFFSLHAFDHLDNLDKQAEPAYQCGVSVIYATGVGVCGYMGIPSSEQWEKTKQDVQKYVQHAKSLGIPVVLGYLCSTSIVGIETFDKNWQPELKQQFSSTPNNWLQQNIKGEPLPSWYGGDYHPACMNHPDWRKYEKYMVKTSLEIGLDGIFFDNPTVHQQGCYCPYCMHKFLQFLESKGEKVEDTSLDALRELTQKKPVEFKQFRCTIARDFLSEIRNYAREINPKALITANNSLNTPEVMFSQCHRYAYNIKEMSKSQDFVVIEDMRSTPRRTAQGKIIECSPVYNLVNSVIGSKSLVAVTIADGDYHTPPNLTNLAIFEAFARNTNYMLWPTWEESQREKMIQGIRPFVQWLKQNASPIITSKQRYDVLLYFPFDEWIEHEDCKELNIAKQLTQANILYAVASEDNIEKYFSVANIILASEPGLILPSHSKSIFELCKRHNKTFIDTSSHTFLTELYSHLPHPSLKITGDEMIRGVIRETAETIFVLLYNLNIERISSYEDKVVPARDISISIRVSNSPIGKVLLSTPEKEQNIEDFKITKLSDNQAYLTFHISELPLTAIISINHL